MTTNPPIAYRLVDEETGTALVTAKDVQGFFTDHRPPVTVAFTGTQHIDPAKRKAESTELEILNHRQETIGTYYIGRVSRLAPTSAHGGEHATPTAEFLFAGNACEYPEAKEIWLRWAAPEPIEYGEWARYPSDLHETWLHVVQKAWAVRGRDDERHRADETVEVDGRQTTTEAGFYCALGEAVNGPGGYFGSNTGALAELLTFYREAGHRFRLLWNDSTASQDMLGEKFTNYVVGLMHDSGVVELVLR
jgi:hypothetical protein